MKQYGLKIFLVLLLFNVSVRVFGQSSFTIVGTCAKINARDSLFLSYKDQGKYILQKTVANDKEFTFSGSINGKEPIKAFIYRNENPELVNVITENTELYLEPGIIRIVSSDSLNQATIGGTRLNDTLQVLNNQLAHLRKKRTAIKEPDSFSELEKQDTAFLNTNKRELDSIFYQTVNIELAFAKKHPYDYISLDILLNRSRINSYINKVESIFDNLAVQLKESPQGKTISERISKKHQVVPGMKAIDFTMRDNYYKSMSLSTFHGKYILLDFWASWCGPCREEHPKLIALYKKYKNTNFTILGISIDTDRDSWLKAITKDNITWTQLSDLKGNKGGVYLKYGITSIPANFLIDPNGIIVAKDLQGERLQSVLSTIFKD